MNEERMEQLIQKLHDAILNVKDSIEMHEYLEKIKPDSEHRSGYLEAISAMNSALNNHVFRNSLWKEVQSIV